MQHSCFPTEDTHKPVLKARKGHLALGYQSILAMESTLPQGLQYAKSDILTQQDQTHAHASVT